MIIHQSISQLLLAIWLVIVAADDDKAAEAVKVARLSSSSQPASANTKAKEARNYNSLHSVRPHLAGFATNYRGPSVGSLGKYGPSIQGLRPGGSAVGLNSQTQTDDFNPALLGGYRGNPGIKIRINQRAFQYATSIVSQVLNREIVRARIPDITQEVSQVNGVITVCNIHVSHYRPPCSIQIFPSPPNLITLRVNDFDIGVTGNLDGIALILLPIKIYGIVHVNLYHVSAAISIAIERAPDGSPYVVLCGCEITIPSADVCIEQGGLVGDLANIFAREEITKQVKDSISPRVCKMLPGILNQRVNPMLRKIPQSVGFSQFASMFGSLLGPQVPARCFSPACQAAPTTTLAPALPAQPPNNPPPPAFGSGGEQTALSPATAQDQEEASAPNVPQPVPVEQAAPAPNVPQTAPLPDFDSGSQVAAQPQPSNTQLAPYREGKKRVLLFSGKITKADIILPKVHESLRAKRESSQEQKMQFSSESTPLISRRARNVSRIQIKGVHSANRSVTSLARGVPIGYRGSVNSAVGLHGIGNGAGSNPCAGCPASSDGGSSMAGLQSILLQQLDMKKLADVVLTTQMMRTFATPYNFNIDLNGEFSPRGAGGTPFAPFPMNWPTPIGQRMVEIMISDYTINSLLYAMHKRNFLSFRIGPDTPGIGALLTTTCDSGDYDTEDGDSDGELLLSRLLRLRNRRRQRHHQLKRHRRQALGSLDDLADLGICIGDIMPAVKEKYPDRKLSIVIHTARAPSIQLSGQGGGLVALDLMALADIYLDGTNTRVGTLVINAAADVALRIVGNRISGTAALQTLKLRDRYETLGLQQDTLDNLSNLAKGMIVKVANQQLQKGMVLNIPTSNLPINIINPEFRVLNHAIYIASDFSIAPSMLQSI